MVVCLIISGKEPSTQQIESHLARTPADKVSITREKRLFFLNAILIREPEPDRTDRLFFRAAVRASNSGHRNRIVGPGIFANAGRHRLSRLTTYRTKSFNYILRDAQSPHLGLI